MSYLIELSDYILTAVILLLVFVLWRRLTTHDFLALAISSSLCIFAAEGISRLLDLGNPENMNRVIWSEERAEVHRYSYTPNSQLVYEYPDNPRGYFNVDNKVVGTINSKGFRGPERDLLELDNKTIVAFLGDSITLGFGLRDEDTLPSQFEAAMRGKYEHIKALNFGVTDTSTPYQAKLLEEYVLSFSPHAVVIVVFLNDTERIGTLNFMSIRFFERIRRRSYFINALASSVESVIINNVMIEHYRSGYLEDNPAWQDVKAALKQASTLSESREIPLVVAIYPVLIHLDEGYPFREVHATIAQYCRSIDVVVVDLLQAFNGGQGPELWVHRSDQHPNEIAQREAAALLAEVFIAHGLLEWD